MKCIAQWQLSGAPDAARLGPSLPPVQDWIHGETWRNLP